MAASASTHVFRAEYDEEGVYVYQAFGDSIADHALAHGRFGGPDFNPARMTWIKPSFAWMLYRSGYGRKDPGQKRILKIKVPHKVLAEILRQCACEHGGGGCVGRVQWDPERDLWHAEPVTATSRSKSNRMRTSDKAEQDQVEGAGCPKPSSTRASGKRVDSRVESAECLSGAVDVDTTTGSLPVQPAKIATAAEDVRSIQIGISKELSQCYCATALEITDVTDLAHAVGVAHTLTTEERITAALRDLQLPNERAYVPHVSDVELIRLKLREETRWEEEEEKEEEESITSGN